MVLLVLHACHVVLLLVLRWFWCGSAERFQAALPQPRQMQASRADAGDFGAPHVGDLNVPGRARWPGAVAWHVGWARGRARWPATVAARAAHVLTPCPYLRVHVLTQVLTHVLTPCPNPRAMLIRTRELGFFQKQ